MKTVVLRSFFAQPVNGLWQNLISWNVNVFNNDYAGFMNEEEW